MSRKFIASVLAASLAVTSFSVTPAKADGDDLVRFLAGATALVIIGNALDDNGHRSRNQSNSYDDRGRHDDHYGRYDRQGYGDNRGGRRDNNDRGRQDHRAERDTPNRLPPGCLTRVDSRHGQQQVFGQSCLREHYSFAQSLPRECRVEPRGPNAPRRAYSADCLFARGYYAGRR